MHSAASYTLFILARRQGREQLPDNTLGPCLGSVVTGGAHCQDCEHLRSTRQSTFRPNSHMLLEASHRVMLKNGVKSDTVVSAFGRPSWHVRQIPNVTNGVESDTVVSASGRPSWHVRQIPNVTRMSSTLDGCIRALPRENTTP